MGWGCAGGRWQVAIFIFLRSGVEGYGWMLFDDLGPRFCVAFANYWAPRLGYACLIQYPLHPTTTCIIAIMSWLILNIGTQAENCAAINPTFCAAQSALKSACFFNPNPREQRLRCLSPSAEIRTLTLTTTHQATRIS